MATKPASLSGSTPGDTILFVSLPRALGGSNRSLVTLLSSLDGKVQRVLASHREGPFADFATARGVADEWVHLRQKGRLRRLRRIVDALQIAWWAQRNRGRLTAIHANATTGLNTAAVAGILTRRPLVVWVHDPVATPWGRRLGPWLRRLIPDLRVAVVSQTAADVAVEIGICTQEETTLVPNPIDPTDVVFEQASPHDGVTVAILGGTSRRKGFDQVPRVAAAVADLDVRWLLYVNPQPNQENKDVWAELGRLGDDVITVPGRTSDVRNAYAGADIVFCPSREESFCRVAAEAMMNGIPVVGSDIPPLRNLLGDGAGLLFDIDDPTGAATAIRRLADDEGLRHNSGQIGRRRAAEFLPATIADKLCRLYGIDGARLPDGAEKGRR